MSKGVDIAIDALVTDMTSNLWTGNVTAFYGRVWRNVTESGKISPEVWVAPNEYVEVLKDGSKDAQCFFDVQPDADVVADIYTSTVWACFMVNLLALYPLLTREQASQRVTRDVEKMIESSLFDNKGMISGFKAMESYDWSNGANQALTDMSPHYLFRFNLETIYTIDNE